MDFIVTIAINPAKNFFPVHGVVSKGTPVPFCASVPRTELRELIAAVSTLAVEMGACIGERQLRGRVAKVRSGPGAVGQWTATKPSSDDERLHGVAQPHAQSYSVWNEFAKPPLAALLQRWASLFRPSE